MSDLWDVLSLALKILAVAATIIGIALPILDALNIKLVELSRGQLITVTVAFLAAAFLFGAVDYLSGKRPEKAATPDAQAGGGGNSLTLSGGSSIGNISGSFNTVVTISPGDSPAERERKKKLAEGIVAEEVIGAIEALDGRLVFIDTALAADPFAAQLQAANDQVAPAAKQSWGSGYRTLIAQQRAASLRGAFNSRPLHTELREPLLRQMVEIGTDPAAVRGFYDALTAAVDKSEDLLAIVADPASSDDSTMAGRRLLVQRDTVRAASIWAYLMGLRLLDGLETRTEPRLPPRLAALQALEPKRLPSAAELLPLMERAAQQISDAMQAKAALLEDARHMPAQDLRRLREATDEALRIEPDDPWNVVVGKARSLRDFGRTEEAVRAYAAYAEMFAATDPTAERFSRTAQSFTRALGKLGVNGGVYVYAVRDGDARRAGLLEGDIITACGDHTVSDVAAFQKACHSQSREQNLVLSFLRLSSDGTFARATATTGGASLGIGIMPI